MARRGEYMSTPPPTNLKTCPEIVAFGPGVDMFFPLWGFAPLWGSWGGLWGSWGGLGWFLGSPWGCLGVADLPLHPDPPCDSISDSICDSFMWFKIWTKSTWAKVLEPKLYIHIHIYIDTDPWKTMYRPPCHDEQHGKLYIDLEWKISKRQWKIKKAMKK